LEGLLYQPILNGNQINERKTMTEYNSNQRAKGYQQPLASAVGQRDMKNSRERSITALMRALSDGDMVTPFRLVVTIEEAEEFRKMIDGKKITV
jgi:uncharacterized protein YjgD (DUF1641 family)